jgi:hypothetical protein
MTTIRTFLRKAEKSSYAQVLVIFLSFGFMVLSSIWFGVRSEREHLEETAEAMFTGIESQLEADLKELETMLGVVSESIRMRLLQGADFEEMKTYISGITEYNQKKGIPGFLSVFVYFDIPGQIERNVFSAISPDTDWIGLETAGLLRLDDRDWYILAEAAKGEIVATQPYVDLVTGEVALAYARSLYDPYGNRIAVVGLNILLDRIHDFSAETGNHGNISWMLLDNNLSFVAVPFPEFLGMPLREAHRSGISNIAPLLEQGLEVSGYRFNNVNGEEKIITVRQLRNGWFLGVATSVDNYFENIQNMLWFLIILGILMATGLSIILVRLLAGREKAIAEKNVLSNMDNVMNGIDAMVYVQYEEAL